MELEFRRPLLHEVLIHAGACYVILSCSGQKINGVDIMSYHYSDVTKISDLEELAYDLQADHCLLLMTYDCFHNDDAGDYSKDSLELLTWNQLQMLKQHIDDLWWFYRAICNCGLSKVVLSKRSDSESSSDDPFFGSTDPEVIHDLKKKS